MEVVQGGDRLLVQAGDYEFYNLKTHHRWWDLRGGEGVENRSSGVLMGEMRGHQTYCQLDVVAGFSRPAFPVAEGRPQDFQSEGSTQSSAVDDLEKVLAVYGPVGGMSPAGNHLN